ncbi:sugar phosphate permease [Isoptericola variabilis J7]|nr:sugar phosphate permease [Isoptericola variabilis J7]
MTSSAPAPAATRTERLPFTRAHRRLLVGSGIGWALDAMDVGIMSFVLVAIAEQWSLTTGERSLLASIGFVGMAVGAALGGLLADRIGRRSVFALTLLVYGLATGASALAAGVAALLALRFVVGLGLGAELPVASTLVSEYSPARIRGRVVVVLESFWAVGWIAAAVVGLLLVPSSDDGWRWAFAIGVVPALYALYVRARLPESVRFLERQGRHDDAEAAVRAFERSAGVAAPSAAPPAAEEHGPAAREHAPRVPVRALFTAALRRRTVALWLTWFGVNFAYYGAFTWIPTILVEDGFSMVRSFGYTLIITLAQLPGYAVAAWLIEAWGRRAVLLTFLGGSAVSAVAFGLAGSVPAILAAGIALSFFNLGAWGALYAVTPESYPTPVRATGAGAATAFGRLASITAPLVVLPLRDQIGTAGVFTVFAAAFLLAMAGSAMLVELRDRLLEHEVVAVHDLAVVPLPQLLAQLVRRAAQQRRQLAGVERDEPARDHRAVGRDELDRVAGVELALDARDAGRQERRATAEHRPGRAGVEVQAPLRPCRVRDPQPARRRASAGGGEERAHVLARERRGRVLGLGEHDGHARAGRDAHRLELGDHAARADRAAARGDLDAGDLGEVRHRGDAPGARARRRGVVQPVDVGEQHHGVGAHEVGHERGEAVVVAEAQLVRGDGVVLVDDRHDAEREQLVERALRVAVPHPAHGVLGGEQHLPDPQPVLRERLGVPGDELALPEHGRGLHGREVPGPRGEPERADARRHGARGDEHHLAAVRASGREHGHERTQRLQVEVAVRARERR